ncbi:hypothetical protein Tco_0422298 [Tanacetum coccineum]
MPLTKAKGQIPQKEPLVNTKLLPICHFQVVDHKNYYVVLDEPKVKSVDTHEGTSFKPGVPDVSRADSSESEYKYWGDSGDEDAEYQQDDEEDALESDADLQQDDDEGTDSENQMTNDEDEESEDAFVHTLEDYVPTDDEMNDEINDETKDVDYHNYSSNNHYFPSFITLSFSSIIKPIPTPTNTEPTTSTIAVPESKILSSIHQRICDLEKDVKELKSVDNSTIVISTIKSKVLNVVKEYLESSLDDALYKVIQKHSADIIKEHSILAEIVERLKQQYAPQKRSILKDEDAIDKSVAGELKKRKPDDVDRDDGPTAGSDRGLKKQSTSKGSETSKKTSSSKDSSKGKSPTTSSKFEEPIFVQDPDYAKHDNAEFENFDMPIDQGEDLGKTKENPNDKAVPKND